MVLVRLAVPFKSREEGVTKVVGRARGESKLTLSGATSRPSAWFRIQQFLAN